MHVSFNSQCMFMRPVQWSSFSRSLQQSVYMDLEWYFVSTPSSLALTNMHNNVTHNDWVQISELTGLFGTAHNSFMKLLWAVFLPNTYFQNSFMGEAVFFLLSQKHKLDEAGKK